MYVFDVLEGGAGGKAMHGNLLLKLLFLDIGHLQKRVRFDRTLMAFACGLATICTLYNNLLLVADEPVKAVCIFQSIHEHAEL